MRDPFGMFARFMRYASVIYADHAQFIRGLQCSIRDMCAFHARFIRSLCASLRSSSVQIWVLHILCVVYAYFLRDLSWFMRDTSVKICSICPRKPTHNPILYVKCTQFMRSCGVTSPLDLCCLERTLDIYKS